MPRSTSFVASASECAASARSAVDPEISPLISFAMAMTTFAASATRIVRALSLLRILCSAARERRCGGGIMNANLVRRRSAGVPPAGQAASRRHGLSAPLRLDRDRQLVVADVHEAQLDAAFAVEGNRRGRIH